MGGRWIQGQKPSHIVPSWQVADNTPGGYDVWKVTLVGKLVKLDDGNVNVIMSATLNGQLIDSVDEYEVQRAAVDPQSTVECGQGQCIGTFSYEGRRELEATLTYTLRGLDGKRWTKLASGSEQDSFGVGTNTLTASLSRRRIDNRCAGYSRCEMRVKGQTLSPGKSAARASAKARVG